MKKTIPHNEQERFQPISRIIKHIRKCNTPSYEP